MPIPEFIIRLRSGVGHDPLWLPGVTAVVIDDEGRLLLGRRADNGNWAVVSGIIDPGEEPAVAAVREVLEETGVHAEAVALTAVSASEIVTYDNGDVAQYLDVCFWCRVVGGEARVADDESTDVGWFPADALPQPLNPSTAERVARTLAYVDATREGAPAQPWFVREVTSTGTAVPPTAPAPPSTRP
jgi:8-oxo-dGTP pyrophosphatase MutT (NUDIX family)